MGVLMGTSLIPRFIFFLKTNSDEIIKKTFPKNPENTGLKKNGNIADLINSSFLYFVL